MEPNWLVGCRRVGPPICNKLAPPVAQLSKSCQVATTSDRHLMIREPCIVDLDDKQLHVIQLDSKSPGTTSAEGSEATQAAPPCEHQTMSEHNTVLNRELARGGSGTACRFCP